MDIDDLKRDLQRMSGHIQDLEASQKQTLSELDRFKTEMAQRIDTLTNSVTLGHAATAAMNGTFSSIERHMVKVFEVQAEIDRWRASIEARMDAIEKRQPPAA